MRAEELRKISKEHQELPHSKIVKEIVLPNIFEEMKTVALKGSFVYTCDDYGFNIHKTSEFQKEIISALNEKGYKAYKKFDDYGDCIYSYLYVDWSSVI